MRNNTIHVGQGYTNGICIIQQNRSCIGCMPGPYGQPPQPAINNSALGNVIVFDDCHGTVGEVADSYIQLLAPLGTNTFDRNQYVHYASKQASAKQKHFSWCLANGSGSGNGSGDGDGDGSSASSCKQLSFEEFRSIAKQEGHAPPAIYGSGSCGRQPAASSPSEREVTQ
eukprot:COSAG06_NODE_7487_length_2488_cov_726.691503_5_plen_170_part_00